MEILLLEAGGQNSDPTFLDVQNRYLLPHTVPDLDWSYTTVPQSHLNNRILPYSRGKGLGGSSATNYGAWTVGHQEEFNEWGTIVDDDCWKWDGERGVQQRFKKIENVHISKSSVTTFDPDQMAYHGKAGLVDVAYNPIIDEKRMSAILESAKEQNVSQLSFLPICLTWSYC